MEPYPKRESHFAHKFTRLIFRCCLANEIGPEACYMLIQIAHTEDAAHYRKPVTFFNEQLINVCGFANVKSLDRARRKAIDAGWLEYEPGAKHRPGKYFVTVPEDADGLPDRSLESDFHPGYLAENNQETKRNGESLLVKNDQANGREAGSIREVSGKYPGDNRATFIPNPNPIPVPSPNTYTDAGTRSVETKPKEPPKPRTKKPEGEPPGFAEWYAAYPRHEARASAAKVYEKAVRAFMVRDDAERTVAVASLLEVTLLFADSDAGKNAGFVPHPASWLNAARYFDDPKDWKRETNGKPKQFTIGPGQTFDPAAGKSDPNFGKM